MSPMRADARHLLRSNATGPSRREFLAVGASLATGAGALALTGCGGGTGEATQPTGNIPSHALIAAFPQATPHIAVGVPTRLPYLVADREGVPLAELTEPVAFTVSLAGQPVVDDLEVAPRADGVERAYLPLNVTFPEPGVYDVVAQYQGDRLDGQVQAYPIGDVTTPVVGQPLPPVNTPTTEVSMDVDPICTRAPACPYHEVSLTDALGKGVPVVVLVASPAYCQTAICGPVLDNLMELTAGRTDITVLHSEVYTNPKAVRDLAKAAPAPLPAAYDLAFEPVLYVTDATGRITARADVIVDRSEMAELLP